MSSAQYWTIPIPVNSWSNLVKSKSNSKSSQIQGLDLVGIGFRAYLVALFTQGDATVILSRENLVSSLHLCQISSVFHQG